MNTQALLAENARLRREVEYLKMQLTRATQIPYVPLDPEQRTEHQNLLAYLNALGYNSARDYIEAMADKYRVDVEDARQAFLNCGYEEWNTGFIETLMEMKGE